jgi:putative membrane protein
MRKPPLVAGLILLLIAWAGPLPEMSGHSFAAHMLMHMMVVAIAAPLVALGFAGLRHDPVRRHPALFTALPASLLELAVVWAWHTPVLHQLARTSLPFLVLEQGSFLLAGLLLWMACLGFAPEARASRSAAGVVGLLLTSVHMTLLGALLALAPRPLYGRTAHIDATDDQIIGGIIGGIVYLIGGLGLMTRLLNVAPAAPDRA